MDNLVGVKFIGGVLIIILAFILVLTGKMDSNAFAILVGTVYGILTGANVANQISNDNVKKATATVTTTSTSAPTVDTTIVK